MPKRTDEEMLKFWKSELRRFKKQKGVIAQDNIRVINCAIEKLEEKMKQKKRESNESKKPRPNPFAGADDIYVTKNKIAVTRTKNSRAKRGFTKTTQTKYYEQNDSNLKQLKAAQGDTVRVGRKGAGFKKL